MRVLLGAVASIALIVAGGLILDWYEVVLPEVPRGLERVSIGLRHVQICAAGDVCASVPLADLPGMFPTFAVAALWLSLGLAALVAFQAGARLLSGSANDGFTRLGYLYAMMTLSAAVATAYLFGPETEGPGVGAAAQLGASLNRTWGPATLIAGIILGLATLYMALAPESGDLGAEYKPVTLATARAVGAPGTGATVAAGSSPGDLTHRRSRTPTMPIPLATEASAAERISTTTGAMPAVGRTRTSTGTMPVMGRTTAPTSPTSPTGVTGATGAIPLVGRTRTSTGTVPTMGRTRTSTGTLPPIGAMDASASAGRGRSGPLPTAPAQLRNRLSYVALTAELTAGGIDARREDGSARLVLWRDVVGVVARRMPEVYAATPFVDIVSTAGSTLRVVPWTRITGAAFSGEADAAQRDLVAWVVAMCPTCRVDPATRQFLDGDGPAAQLPDLELLAAHDAHLA